MLILFWIGSCFREDIERRPVPPRSLPPAARPRFSLVTITAATIAVAAVVAVWPEAAARLEYMGARAQPALAAPVPAGGWKPEAVRLTDWVPGYYGQSARFHQAYGKETTRAGLYVAYYRNQRRGAELITSGNALVSGNERLWRNTGQIRRTHACGHGDLSLTEAKLRDSSERLLVWYWYWVDGQYTANQVWGKILQAKARLLGRGDDAAVVIVYALDDDRPQAAEQTLNDFVEAMLPAITRSLENTRTRAPPS